MEQLIAIIALFVGCVLIYKFSVEKKNGQTKCGIYYFAIFKKSKNKLFQKLTANNNYLYLPA